MNDRYIFLTPIGFWLLRNGKPVDLDTVLIENGVPCYVSRMIEGSGDVVLWNEQNQEGAK